MSLLPLPKPKVQEPLVVQALERVAQLDRVMSKPGGAALLCGRAGVGRKSALALVAYMHHMEVPAPAACAQTTTNTTALPVQ